MPNHRGYLLSMFSAFRSIMIRGRSIIDQALTKLNSASEIGCSAIEGTSVIPIW